MLTRQDVNEIREIADLFKRKDLAEMYGITLSNLGHIIRGNIWK